MMRTLRRLIAGLLCVMMLATPCLAHAEDKELWDNGWWYAFVAGQLINGANMNYAQSIGYYEINDWWYGRHPSSSRVWVQKAVETIIIYKVLDNNKKYQDPALILCNALVWGCIISDFRDARIAWRFRF